MNKTQCKLKKRASLFGVRNWAIASLLFLNACGGEQSGPSATSSSSSSSSSNSSSSSSSSSGNADSSITIQEEQNGFCGVDGVSVENTHDGFTGSGYSNTDNYAGTTIEWSIQAPASGSNYRLYIRYANGGLTARIGQLSINDGSGVHAVTMEPTGAWNNWVTAAVTVDLIEGQNSLELEALGEEGLANVDYLEVVGNDPAPGDCTPVSASSSSSSGSSSSSTSSSSSSSGVGSSGFPQFSELKAFPTAEGYGRYATGGRGGRVVHVTNLNDSGPGSLRAALDETGKRTIVFDVSGVIKLKSKLLITGTKGNGHVTVAGHTAPGKGVVLSGWTFGMIGGSDVIVRFIRTRVGTESGKTMDGMGMASAENSIFDHCSVSWTIDEGFSSRGAHGITLQRSLISEALNEAGHEKYAEGAQHGFCASISGDTGSFHHNLLAHCAGRNWSLAGGLGKNPFVYVGKLDIRNNVVYNWRYRTTDGGAHEVNFVNNYYKPGPVTEVFFALNAQNDGFPGTQRYYFAGNVMEGKWDESNQDAGKKATGEPRDYDPWVSSPFFESYVTTHSAREAYENVLADVGANVPVLDDHDKRIIEEVRNGTFTYRGSKTGYPGLPDNEADVGGLENYPVIHRDANWDSDGDGMPNQWELLHGLDPYNAADGNATTFSDVGYTNLELYLAELAGDF